MNNGHYLMIGKAALDTQIKIINGEHAMVNWWKQLSSDERLAVKVLGGVIMFTILLLALIV